MMTDDEKANATAPEPNPFREFHNEMRKYRRRVFVRVDDKGNRITGTFVRPKIEGQGQRQGRNQSGETREGSRNESRSGNVMNEPIRPKNRDDGFPTRSDMRFWTPAEKAIFEAVQVVEAAGASLALTDAVTLLAKARDRVADHVEGDRQ